MPIETSDKLLLSLTDLSRALGLGREAVYKLLHSEQLPKNLVLNNRRYWLRKDIEGWLENLKGKTL